MTTPTQDDAVRALLASNRRRRSIRKWIAIGTLPLTIAALLLVGKLLSMFGFAHQAIASYVVGDYAGTVQAGQSQTFLNWFEPYKAPFNIGDGHGGALALEDARSEFENALDLATGLEVCAVRINLALVTEWLGDTAVEAGDAAGAAELYAQALEITLETPEECDSEQAQEESPDPDRDMEESLDELEDRLQEKQQQQDDPRPNEPDQGEEEQPAEPDQSDLDELEERLQQGTEDRDQRESGGDDDGGGSGVERPW